MWIASPVGIVLPCSVLTTDVSLPEMVLGRESVRLNGEDGEYLPGVKSSAGYWVEQARGKARWEYSTPPVSVGDRIKSSERCSLLGTNPGSSLHCACK